MSKPTPPKPVRQIPSTVEHIDAETGKVIKTERMSWNVLRPSPDVCQICAVDHEPHWPHDAQSLYYQMTFNGLHGRFPTWADAIAHCDDAMKKKWRTVLLGIGRWSEPPDGEAPIQHHGVE